MYSKTARERLKAKEAKADRVRRVTRSMTIAPFRRREVERLEALRNEVACLALAVLHKPRTPPDRRPLWLRSMEAGKQLQGAK